MEDQHLTAGGDDYSFAQLKAGILRLCKATVWELAKKEWKLLDVSQADEPERCLCGHNPIIELCTISNTVRCYEVEVGNVYVSAF